MKLLNINVHYTRLCVYFIYVDYTLLFLFLWLSKPLPFTCFDVSVIQSLFT